MFSRVPLSQPTSVPTVFSGPFRPVTIRPETKSVISSRFADLARIYEDDVNLCLITRPMPRDIETFVSTALKGRAGVEISTPVDPDHYDFGRLWPQVAELAGYRAWLDDVILLCEAFAELFGLNQVGLRLRTLDKAVCPRFHVDRVPVRLICSYGGIGTEWLPEYAINRAMLGMGACRVPDNQSDLITDATAIRQMPAYTVGLMKGEHWEGNEGRGLVHRSPTPTAVQPRRLIMTIDVM